LPQALWTGRFRLVEAGWGAMLPSIAILASEQPIWLSVRWVEPQVMGNVGLIKRRGRSWPPAALELERLVREMPFRSVCHRVQAGGLHHRLCLGRREELQQGLGLCRVFGIDRNARRKARHRLHVFRDLADVRHTRHRQ